MTPARAALDRLGPWPAFVAFAAIGSLAWGVSLLALMPVVRAIGGGAPIVTLGPRDAMGLPIGLAFFAFAAITLSPAPAAGRSRDRRPRRRVDWPVLCLWLAAAGIALTFVTGGIAGAVVGHVVAARGYVGCPPIVGERPAYARWVRADAAARCPQR